MEINCGLASCPLCVLTNAEDYDGTVCNYNLGEDFSDHPNIPSICPWKNGQREELKIRDFGYNYSIKDLK